MFEVLNLSYTNISLLVSLTITFSLSIFSLFSWFVNKKDKLSFWIFVILLIGNAFYIIRILRFSIQDDTVVFFINRLNYIPFITLAWAGYYHALTYTKTQKSNFGKYLFDYYTTAAVIITLLTPLLVGSTLRKGMTIDGFSWLNGQTSILLYFIVLIAVFQNIYIILILYRSKSSNLKEIYLLIGTWILMIFFVIYESYVIISLKDWIRFQEFIFVPLAIVHFFIRILENSYLRNNLDKEVIQRTKELHSANEDIEKKYVEMLMAKNTINALNEDLKKANKKIVESNTYLSAENVYLQEEMKDKWNVNFIIGEKSKFLHVTHLIEDVAGTNTRVMITGETGTGKELIANAIHSMSLRSEKQLIKLNCAAIPVNLIESELFGYEKGAFTGAFSKKMGRFELAHEGTLFLDEIADLPLKLQSKLLRVIQEGEFERVGGTETLKVDVRIISATNKDLEGEIKKKAFRSDLFYRLNVFPIHIPPLRDRMEDLPVLVDHFVKKYAEKLNKKINNISNTVYANLASYHWPGNIRELENVIERAVVLSKTSKLLLGDWFKKPKEENSNKKFLSLDELQKKHIIAVLKKTNGKISGKNGAADILKINAMTLRSRMQKFQIT